MDIRVGRDDESVAPWSTLSDLAMTMVLLLVIYLVVQFLATFRERFVSAKLAARQQEVRAAILAIGDSAVQVDSLAPDRQRITFSEAALFPVCKASLKPQGAALLGRVSDELGRRQGYFERVDILGHTDTVPISGRPGCPYPSNWELSSARATSVVMLFSGRGAIDNVKISAIGRSEYHPVSDVELRRNRRIELELRYDRVAVEQEMRGRTSADNP